MPHITVITGRRACGKTTLAEALFKAVENFSQKPILFDDVTKINKAFLKTARLAAKEHGHLIIVLEHASDYDRLAEGGLVPSRHIAISLF